MTNIYNSLEKVKKALDERIEKGYKNNPEALVGGNALCRNTPLYRAAKEFNVALPKVDRTNKYTNKDS
jgi:hypothetical protein